MKVPSLIEWKNRGSTHTVLGHSLFVIDEGDHNDETIVILHGYPSCSYDYYACLPILSEDHRVVIHDHLGFGLSGRPEKYSYSLIEQADHAWALWQKLGLKKVHLLAHDYGTSVATEILAQAMRGFEPVKLQSITVGNGSMLIEMAQLLLMQKILRSKRWGPLAVRLATRWNFKKNMSKIWYDKSKVNEEELDVLYDMMWSQPGGKKVFHRVSQYLDERYKYWHRWIGEGLYSTDRHINILWAEKDPVAVIAMGETLHEHIPNNSFKRLPDLGHYPMLEDPEQYAKAVLEMINNTKTTS